MHKSFISFLLCFALIFSLFSCGAENGSPYSHCEYTIPLSSDFYKTENPEYDVSFTNGTEYVAILRLSYAAAVKSGIPETYSADEFGDYWLKECGRTCDMLKYGDIDYCDYIDSANGGEFYYLAVFYRSKNAYFVVLFATNADSVGESKGKFLKFADEAYFTD